MSHVDDSLDPNIRSSIYNIVRSETPCPKCHRVTSVFALSLPAGFQALYVYDETPENEPGDWVTMPMSAFLPYVLHFSEPVATRIRRLTALYRIDIHNATDRPGWWNHCEHCGAQVDDEYLHHLEGPFSSAAFERRKGVEVHCVREAFSALAGSVLHVLKALDD